MLHLIGVYMYAGGRYEWVKWGSISIGIVDETPNAMNPFQYGKDSSTDIVYRFLFRWLVRYDMATGIYVGDLTSCDLTDMMSISCTLRDDAIWSDGTRIKTDDIIASIDTFRKNAQNPDIKTFLESVKVTKNGDTVEFKANKKSEHMITILTYPVMRSDTIAPIIDGTIAAKNYVTSGPYIFLEKVADPEYGFDRITLGRNEKSSKSVWLDKINFKFFKDLPSLERSTETLTIIIPPKKNENLEIGARFREYLYTNYEYFSVFLNTDSMSRILRNTLHWQIWTYFSDTNILEDHKRVKSIFLSGWALLPTENLKGFSDVLRDIGYTKKLEILSRTEKISTTVSGEVVYNTAKYWTTKGDVTTLFVSDAVEEMSLRWTVPANTLSVTINGYTLREFVPGNTIFAYRVSRVAGTLKEWENIYTLVIEKNDWTRETENLTLYFTQDTAKMDEYKKQKQDAYNASQNTPALVANREREKAEKIKELQTLRDDYYYNDKNDIFTIKIWYVSGPQSTESYANNIAEALRLLGVRTELIPYGPKDVQAIITSGEKKYDILVIGVSVEGSLSSIGTLFAANESGKGGVNFSNIESKTLDSLFIDLRWTNEWTKREKIEQSIAKIMNTESFFVPISSPNHRIWIDRNIKWMPNIEIIPDVASFAEVFVETSIKENYIRSTGDKSVSGFFLWMASKL